MSLRDLVMKFTNTQNSSQSGKSSGPSATPSTPPATPPAAPAAAPAGGLGALLSQGSPQAPQPTAPSSPAPAPSPAAAEPPGPPPAERPAPNLDRLEESTPVSEIVAKLKQFNEKNPPNPNTNPKGARK